LYRHYDRVGYLEVEDEKLLVYIQEFIETRFNQVELQTVLDFAVFFRELGIWYWNINLMERISQHFT